MNNFKNALRTGTMAVGAWSQLGSANAAEVLVHFGWKNIIIDGEHGAGTLEDWVDISRAIVSAGGTPILRLPDADDSMIKRALDRGFKNFIVPMVNTRAEAEQIVSAFYYPLKGHRGYAASIVRGSNWGARPDYGLVDSFNEITIIIQCEHIEAVDQIDDIMAVEGVDMIFIGPNDLAASAGHLEHLDHPEVLELITTVEAAAERHDMPLATVRSAGRDWKELDQLGYRMIAGIFDVAMLVESARRNLTEATGQIAAPVKTY